MNWKHGFNSKWALSFLYFTSVSLQLQKKKNVSASNFRAVKIINLY